MLGFIRQNRDISTDYRDSKRKFSLRGALAAGHPAGAGSIMAVRD
jgi:hypothetical protein